MLAMNVWGVLRSLERSMAPHTPRNGGRGFPDESSQHSGIRAMPRLRRDSHQPTRAHRRHHKCSPDIGLGNNSVRTYRGHIFRIWADNTSALSWLKNTSCDTNPIFCCLVRFLMATLVASGIPCIIQGEHIPGEKNVGADRLFHPTLSPTWASIIADCPQVNLWWRCHLPPGLLSALASTIY
jgi:hypothetical protein